MKKFKTLKVLREIAFQKDANGDCPLSFVVFAITLVAVFSLFYLI